MVATVSALASDALRRAKKVYRSSIGEPLLAWLGKTNSGKAFRLEPLRATADYLLDLDEANAVISSALRGDRPFMAGRFGESELRCFLQMSRIERWSRCQKTTWAASGHGYPRWRPEEFRFMSTTPGFFPTNKKSLFVDFMAELESATTQMDLIGSWVRGETQLEAELSQAKVTRLSSLEPFFADEPWTLSLAGLRVLVVHPFADSIAAQFSRRERLFPDKKILPDFQLQTIRPPQTTNAEKRRGEIEFTDWFDAYGSLKENVLEANFDVAIIGAGAYGMPLAAEIKKIGRKSIHLGGATQLLFGIWGRRWDSSSEHRSLRNSQWVRPSPSETPKFVEENESGGAYY